MDTYVLEVDDIKLSRFTVNVERFAGLNFYGFQEYWKSSCEYLAVVK